MTTLPVVSSVQAQTANPVLNKPTTQRVKASADSVLFSSRQQSDASKTSGIMATLATFSVAALTLVGCASGTTSSSEVSSPVESAPTSIVVEDAPDVTEAPSSDVEIADAVTIEREEVPADTDGEVVPVIAQEAGADSVNSLCNDVLDETEQLRCVLTEALPPEVRNDSDSVEFIIEAYSAGLFTKVDLAFMIQESAGENDKDINYRDYEFFDGVEITDHITLEDIQEDFADSTN